MIQHALAIANDAAACVSLLGLVITIWIVGRQKKGPRAFKARLSNSPPHATPGPAPFGRCESR
jgi:hypothetical protein